MEFHSNFTCSSNIAQIQLFMKNQIMQVIELHLLSFSKPLIKSIHFSNIFAHMIT